MVRPELVVGDSEQALFLTRLGERMEPDPLTGRVRNYVRESGVGKKRACHLFRHAMATMMIDTTAIYTHLSITKLREVYMQRRPVGRLDNLAEEAKDEVQTGFDGDSRAE